MADTPLPDQDLESSAHDVLAFVICGMEHTGTTLLSDLFRQVPGIDAGFETGVLLGASPRAFPTIQPFAQNVKSGWGISAEELLDCCNTDEFPTFYARLKAISRVIAPQTEQIFDKTPRYISTLDASMARVPVPFIVSHKDPRAILFSDFKRAKTDQFDDWYQDYLPIKRQYVNACYDQWMKGRADPRVCSVSLEELAMNSRATIERMFAHVCIPFRLDYVLMRDLRYKNTRAPFVSAEIAFEYKHGFNAAQQSRIASDFGKFEHWFYD